MTRIAQLSQLLFAMAYSTALVPERVAQALNLNLEEMGAKPYFVLDHGKLLSVDSTLTRKRLHQLTKSDSLLLNANALISRRDAVLSHQKRNHRLPHPTPPAIREIRLPQDNVFMDKGRDKGLL
ncbi:hypothetical protein C4D60_Mb10t15970 [Musa balbisiana]|uniref:Uncharacterized protein n=1 Tax=Musa balbisiana TaxID=52838 RepID=A0A4S8IXK0_MUSBA|nr:hypothetical protein C4D60_Mb10t15970 [Musa balbisiana]